MDKRLAKLLMLALSTDQPGEAWAAIAAIQRWLKRNKHDVHWLLDEMPAPPTKPRVRKNYPHDMDDWDHQITWLGAVPEFLSHREFEFIESLMSQRQRWHRWEPTIKQRKWLASIYLRVTLVATPYR
jgi:hypothetical protein